MKHLSMGKWVSGVVAVLCCTLGLSSAQAALKQSSIRDIDKIERQLNEIDRELNITPNHVLVVFDVDDTLLTPNQDLGSTAWFQWQESLIQKNPRDPRAVGKSVDELSAVGAQLLTATRMHPVEPDEPQAVEQLQQDGFQTMVLTARGLDLRDATARDLMKNGYDFTLQGVGPTHGYAGALNLPGLSAPIGYTDGVVLAHFQNKGKVLRALLNQTDTFQKARNDEIKAIVFVDDSSQNIQDMVDAFSDSPLLGYALHYIKRDDDKAAFMRSFERQQNTVIDFSRYRETDERVFPKVFQSLDAVQ